MDRQHPPAAARTNQVAHGIDHLAEIYFSRSPPATRLGHQRRNLLPLLVCEVRRIALDLLGDLGHPATALLCPHPELESEIRPQRNPPPPFSKRSLRPQKSVDASFGDCCAARAAISLVSANRS